MPATSPKPKAAKAAHDNGEPLAESAKILVIDIGGTKIKMLATGETEQRKFPSGKRLTPQKLVDQVHERTKDWPHDAISIGYPGLIGAHGPRSEPGNLGPGWVGFNFAAAFGRPVRIINDAAMQALGSYDGGRMLFLGLGTGLGSALIADKVIVPLELGRITWKNGPTLGELLGRAGLRRLGKSEWRKQVHEAAANLLAAFVVDYVVIGGGNAKNLKELPPGIRLGHNQTAFRGGFRLWNVDDIPTLSAEGHDHPLPEKAADWRHI